MLWLRLWLLQPLILKYGSWIWIRGPTCYLDVSIGLGRVGSLCFVLRIAWGLWCGSIFFLPGLWQHFCVVSINKGWTFPFPLWFCCSQIPLSITQRYNFNPCWYFFCLHRDHWAVVVNQRLVPQLCAGWSSIGTASSSAVRYARLANIHRKAFACPVFLSLARSSSLPTVVFITHFKCFYVRITFKN